MSADTRTKLLEGALRTVTEQGIAKTSARTIAAAAGVNQALVFYHFGSVDELLAGPGGRRSRRLLASFATVDDRADNDGRDEKQEMRSLTRVLTRARGGRGRPRGPGRGRSASG